MHMHSESFTHRQIRHRRERGQRMAQARWKAEHQRRSALAEAEARDPLRTPGGRIVRRIIVILEERDVTEIVIREGDSAREIGRKLKRAGLTLSRT